MTGMVVLAEEPKREIGTCSFAQRWPDLSAQVVISGLGIGSGYD
jgi:hypothetical protein